MKACSTKTIVPDQADPKPIILAVDELLRRPGARREYTDTVVVPDLALIETGIFAKDEIRCALELEAQGTQIMVTGSLNIGWRGTCLRCLDDVEGSYDDPVQEIFEPVPVDGETYALDRDNTIDIEPLLREHVLLSLPLNTLCAADCEGADPERFSPTVDVRDTDAADEPEVRIDERWAALDQLDFD